MKQKILDKINEIILDEKGYKVTMDSMFTDGELDSLGTMITLITLDACYPFLAKLPEDKDPVLALDVPNLTIRELVKKCKLSITTTSSELN